MNIGSDELILWLRKNDKAANVSNEKLGKEIREIIENLGGELLEQDVPSQWGNDKNVDRYMLPKTAAQYRIGFERASELYSELNDRYKKSL